MPGPAARVGDSTAHGGVITGPGVPNVLIGGMPASVVGDMHVCPMATPGTPPIPHVGGPTSSPGAPTVLIGGRPAATIGSMCVCVGPPDSIIMGAPTVILGTAGSGAGSAGRGGGGGAAGANASAASAAFDNKESVMKEEHWLEIAFVDKAGNPVSGVPYRLKDPSGNESEGVLRLDGKVRRDALEQEGQAEVTLFSVSGAKWSKESASAGDEVTLSASVEGFEAGQSATFLVYRRAITGPDILVASIEAKTQSDKVEAAWSYTYEPDEEVVVPEEGIEVGPAAAGKYAAPVFFFEVVLGPCKARSGVLRYEDYIEIEVVDEDGAPLASEDYVLYLSSGEVRKGQTDGAGKLREENVAPGGHSVRFPNLPELDIEL